MSWIRPRIHPAYPKCGRTQAKTNDIDAVDYGITIRRLREGKTYQR